MGTDQWELVGGAWDNVWEELKRLGRINQRELLDGKEKRERLNGNLKRMVRKTASGGGTYKNKQKLMGGAYKDL